MSGDEPYPAGGVSANAATDPREAAEEVVSAAVRAGGRDNATAIVVDVVEVLGLVDGVSGGVS